jgi:hypothetical protein
VYSSGLLLFIKKTPLARERDFVYKKKFQNTTKRQSGTFPELETHTAQNKDRVFLYTAARLCAMFTLSCVMALGEFKFREGARSLFCCALKRLLRYL